MTVNTAILAAMEEILGLDQQEMSENLDLNLFETELLDSLTLVAVINQTERILGHRIEFSKMKPEDFYTINCLTKAISRQINS